MSTWDEDYPGGYECCASGSCEVCRGLQGLARSVAHPCHGQIDGQQELVPDPRTTTDVPF